MSAAKALSYSRPRRQTDLPRPHRAACPAKAEFSPHKVTDRDFMKVLAARLYEERRVQLLAGFFHHTAIENTRGKGSI